MSNHRALGGRETKRKEREEGSELPRLAPSQPLTFFLLFGLPPTRRLVPSLFSCVERGLASHREPRCVVSVLVAAALPLLHTKAGQRLTFSQK